MAALCGLWCVVIACVAVLGIGGCSAGMIYKHRHDKPLHHRQYGDIGNSTVDDDLARE